jgi:hypothetical protein
MEVLEQENQRLSEANEVVKRQVGEVSDCCPKVKKDLTNLERELAKLKEEMRTMKPLAPSGMCTYSTCSTARKPLSGSSADTSSSELAKPPLKPVPVKVSPVPDPPRQAKQFPPSVKKGTWFDVPDGIIAHLTKECGGNVHGHLVDITSGSFKKEIHGGI